MRFAEAVIDEIRRRFGAPLYAGRRHLRAGRPPVLLELEAIEPSLYFDEAPGVADSLADAILARGRISPNDRSAWPCSAGVIGASTKAHDRLVPPSATRWACRADRSQSMWPSRWGPPTTPGAGRPEKIRAAIALTRACTSAA